MIISLYDYDIMKYKVAPLNIDLMKIAAYYKKKKDIVIMSPRIDLEKYKKIFYRKDYYDGNFDGELLNNPIIEFGGYGFDNLYHPLPYDIECMQPDTSIYSILLKNNYTQADLKLIERMMRAEHIRLSLDGKTVWKDWECQIRDWKHATTFIFHDKDLNKIEGAYEVVESILNHTYNKKQKYIGIKFPMSFTDENDFLKWTKFKPMVNLYNLEFLGILSDGALVQFCENQKGTSIAAQSKYIITEGLEEQDIVSKVDNLYKQLVYLRTHRINFPLIYNEAKFSDSRWCRVLDLFKLYYKQALNMKVSQFEKMCENDCLFWFAKHLKDDTSNIWGKSSITFTKDNARDVFRFVRDNNTELFNDFYNCKKVHLEGGKLVND